MSRGREGEKPLEITVKEAAAELLRRDGITILCHGRPDGDTLGSGFGLWYALTGLGKAARVLCSDGLPENYAFLAPEYRPGDFAENYIVAVDVASPALLGNLEAAYGGRVDLCIDHHPSNTRYAGKLVLQDTAAATAEIIWELLGELGIPMPGDGPVARCLYTGIATDTGCFRFSSTTPRCLRIAADFVESGLDTQMVNTAMFESKSRGRVALEAAVLSGIRYFLSSRCAVITVPRALQQRLEVDDSQLEGLASIPREIQGVWVGITIKEREDGCRVSVRTTPQADASRICAAFGGGGHLRAAGCTIQGSPEQAAELLVEEAARELERTGACPQQ